MFIRNLLRLGILLTMLAPLAVRCAPFRSFWNANGGLALFGFPITQAQQLPSRTDGRTYLTQYFERERLEYHPELRGTPYEVLLGLLGAEELRIRGYLP